jgi:hypothetical protein
MTLTTMKVDANLPRCPHSYCHLSGNTIEAPNESRRRKEIRLLRRMLWKKRPPPWDHWCPTTSKLDHSRVPVMHQSFMGLLVSDTYNLEIVRHRIDDRDLIPLTIVSIDLQTSANHVSLGSSLWRPDSFASSSPASRFPNAQCLHPGDPSSENMAER